MNYEWKEAENSGLITALSALYKREGHDTIQEE